MTATARPAHAKKRPPSAAARWLSCPGSVEVVPLYPNDETTYSEKGGEGHKWVENGIIFGTRSDTGDAEQDEYVDDCLDWIRKTRNSYGGDSCRVYAEEVYDIPETGEFGTADVTFVSPLIIHVADYKNGFVMVEHNLNAQMMLYLCGAIAKHGTRDKYAITVMQPYASHIEGPYRTYNVTQDDLDWFRGEVAHAVKSKDFIAGKHCKKTYCPHRGACWTLLQWAETEGADAWFPSEVNGMSDEALSRALDHAEILKGIRDELRKEAMRRIMNMDRTIGGYKVVKGRQNRDFAGDKGREQVFSVAREMGATEDDLYSKSPVSVKGIEDYVRTYCRAKGMPNGTWKKLWENQMAQYVNEYVGGLTLERATDARPAHRRGNEFTPLLNAPLGTIKL